jgi:hypothetical protein
MKVNGNLAINQGSISMNQGSISINQGSLYVSSTITSSSGIQALLEVLNMCVLMASQ